MTTQFYGNRNMMAAEDAMTSFTPLNAGQIQQIVNRGAYPATLPSQNGAGYVPTPYGAQASFTPIQATSNNAAVTATTPVTTTAASTAGFTPITPTSTATNTTSNSLNLGPVSSSTTPTSGLDLNAIANSYQSPFSSSATAAAGSGVRALNTATPTTGDTSFLSNAWQGTKDTASGVWDSIGGWQGLNTGLQTATGLFQTYQGMKTLQLAEDQFDFQKNAWQENYNMQKDAYDRQVAQVESRKAFFTKDDDKEA
jgi:hypothetical protein